VDQPLSFRSSGAIVQQVQQADRRIEIVVIQVNIVPVSGQDDMDMVARMAVGTVEPYDTSMSTAEIVEALRYAADQLEASG
jgi:negative regulator of genetic competence, sporulation and motility